MAISVIDVGTGPNDPGADTIRQGFMKCNANFAFLNGQFLSGFVTNATVNSYFADPSNNGSFAPSVWRTELDVYSASEVDAYFADPSTNGSFSASTWRGDLGLGTMATQNASAVTITGGTITGITDLAIADGGTGASTAPNARTNLGLGTIATQDANNVSITGGSITGIVDLAIADGGTGASTAPNARTNLGVPGLAVLNTFTRSQIIDAGATSNLTITSLSYSTFTIVGGSNQWVAVADASNSDLIFEHDGTGNQFGIDSSNGLFFDGMSYINFSTSNGSSGFGIRNNSGVIEKKNLGGSWNPIAVITADNNFTVPQSLPGVTNASDAAAGDIGEFVEDTEASGVTVANLTPTNVLSVSLSAGDWDVESTISATASSPSAGDFIAGISTTSGTMPANQYRVRDAVFDNLSGSYFGSISITRRRVNVSSPATVYVVVNQASGVNMNVTGYLNARRVR